MSNGSAVVSTWNRWLGTTWKMSPALMYSWQWRTTASYCSRVKLDLGVSRAGPSVSMSVRRSSGPGSARRAASSSTRAQARSYAALGASPASRWACATTRIVLRMWSKRTIRS